MFYRNIQCGGRTALLHDHSDHLLAHLKAIEITKFITPSRIWIKLKAAIDTQINALP